MLALVYLGLAICVGERLCSLFFRFISPAHRWATGTLVGLLVSACFTYLTARHFASSELNPLLWGDIIFFICAAIFLAKVPARRDVLPIETRGSRSATSDWITLGIFLAVACWMMFATLNFREGRVEIGLNQWSDYGPNTAIVQNFAFGRNFPAEYPHYAGEPIRYHFLFYFVAGNLEYLGLNLAWAENIISIVTMVSLLALVMTFGELLFKSRAVGIIAAFFFFFHGTLSVLPFLKTQTGGKFTWEGIKTAAKAGYNLQSYLSSGYPYRGEDWGVWSQVVYVNQRHLASSIGLFLVVLIFLFDRYLQKARERELARAYARRVRSTPVELTHRPSSPVEFTNRYADEGPSSAPATPPPNEIEAEPLAATHELPPVEGPASPSGLTEGSPSPEQVTHAEEHSINREAAETGHGITGSSEVATDFRPGHEGIRADEPPSPSNEGPSSSPVLAQEEEARRESNIGSHSEPAPPEIHPREETRPVANYASSKSHPAETVPSPNEWSPKGETEARKEAEPSSFAESSAESARTTDDMGVGAPPPTFTTRAYDEYMGAAHRPEGISETTEGQLHEIETKAAKIEGEKVAEVHAEHVAAPQVEKISETQAEKVAEPTNELCEQPVTEQPSEVLPAVPPVSEPVVPSGRGKIADLLYDTFVNGKSFVFCGLLLGCLPYWNAPVFTAAAAVLAFLFVLFPYRRQMMALGLVAGVVAAPQILALRAGHTRSGSSLIHWGYTLGAVPVTQVLKYIWWTFGLKWILILIALLFFSWRNIRFFIAIFSLFLLTFCLQFSDENLANHKFLNIWLVLANLLVAYGVWRLWRLKILGTRIPTRLLAIALIFPIFLGGAIDLMPLHNLSYIETNYTKDKLIDWIRAETKPDAVFLTDKFVNHPILLAGRKIFFGYTYFTWGAGYDLPRREPAYKLMFESKNAHQVFTLLKANRIDYVAYDAGVRGVFKNNNEQEVYAPNFKKVFEGADYWQLNVYKVPDNADYVPATSVAAGGGSAAGPSAFEGGKGKDPGQFDFPRGLATDSAGNILIADSNNNRLQKFSPTGAFLSVIGKPGSGPGDFQQPGGIALDSTGRIYVADVSNHRIQKLKSDGSFISEWRGPDNGFYGPRDIAIGPDDSVYVVDEGHGRIVKSDADGRTTLVWGMTGAGDGQFGDATSVAIDAKHNKLYVADPGNRRIQVFDMNGKFLSKWTVEEWRPTGWSFQDLVVDPDAGRLYASSVGSDEILVYDLDGKKIQSLRPAPPDRLEGCSSLALVKGKLYALNTYGNRLSWIEIPK